MRDELKGKLIQRRKPGEETSLVELNPILLHLNKIIHEKESDKTKVATGVQHALAPNPYYDQYDRYDPKLESGGPCN